MARRGALLGAIFGFGAMAAIGWSAASVRADEEATEPPRAWTFAAAMGPWAREEALREMEYWLLRHLEGDEENADAYVALQALRGLPGHYALGGLVENGYLARAEDVLARSPDAERHDVERVARAYGATGDFVSGSRVMAAHPERMAEGSFAQPEVLMHLLAGNLPAARRAQEREVDEDDRACLAAYLRARLGIDAEEAQAELMSRVERDDACRLLHADL
ncbi:MAG TPA: hypothetical protein RMH80_26205, partial [Polyangiaceae bacterium LLY-WYZ-15_(1-7)]|nr:hypothetical protein [Polyangiaceae bacterium LLY-WYZ-15_(1-7)]